MLVIHIGTECYPAVKNGGLADVIGALPKYLITNKVNAKVVIPYVDNHFTQSQELIQEFSSHLYLGKEKYTFSVLKNTLLDFDLFFIHIPGLLDKTNVYGYENDTIRFLAFQIAVIEWLKSYPETIDLLHCHDHNTGLIPFFAKFTSKYFKFAETSVVYTVHNSNYQGIMPLDTMNLFPKFDSYHTPLLIWNESINSMAAGIQCADKVTTVSPNYMNQLCLNSHGLEYLFQSNRLKCTGILNGIDNIVWNPETDPLIIKNYTTNKAEKGKKANKAFLCKEFGFDEKSPLYIYIGKLIPDKGGDILEKVIEKSIKAGIQGNFLIMGKGNDNVLRSLQLLKQSIKNRLEIIPELEEELGHRMFAGADFYLMPSREEPCGLGQMYALRYGTIPIVSNAGGLDDTVINFEQKNGFGIKFSYYSADDIYFSILKAEKIYQDKGLLHLLRKRMMALDFSWTNQAKKYISLYNELILNANVLWKLT